MKLKKSRLLLKIERINQLVDQLSNDFFEFPSKMQHILQTAPQALSDLKHALKRGNKETLMEVHAVLEGMETIIKYAAGMACGESMAESIKSGVSPDPSLSAAQRLNQRMTQFLAKYVDRERFSDLIREFCGEKAVQGNTIYMDPRAETEAFSQWILFDKVLSGLPKRLAEMFAEEGKLPSDERSLLEAWLQDHPSIYQVTKMDKEDKCGKYLVKDLLSEKVFNIKDRSTLMSLDEGSIFIRRAFPATGEISTYLLMGSVTEISAELWEKLSVLIKKWRRDFFEEGGADFFRAHHARIQGFIYERDMGDSASSERQ